MDTIVLLMVGLGLVLNSQQEHLDPYYFEFVGIVTEVYDHTTLSCGFRRSVRVTAGRMSYWACEGLASNRNPTNIPVPHFKVGDSAKWIYPGFTLTVKRSER